LSGPRDRRPQRRENGEEPTPGEVRFRRRHGELSRQFLYKARWHGVEVRVADRFFPSSKTCSGCGEVKKDLDLSTRTYSCENCGLVIDRDLNAAINLARWQPKESSEVSLLDPTPLCFSLQPDPTGICTAKHAGRADRHPHNHHDNVMRALVGTEYSVALSSETSDGEQAPLGDLLQLVKVNRWVQLGHTLLGGLVGVKALARLSSQESGLGHAR